MLRRIPTSALKAPGRRSLVSLTSSARPTVNPNSTSQQNASTTSSSLSASAKMFEFDVKSVAGEMRKRGLTSAATRDAGMDRVSSEDLFFLSEMGHALSPERFCLYRHLSFIRLSSCSICSGTCTFTLTIPSGLSLESSSRRTPSSVSSTLWDLVTKSNDTSESSARLLPPLHPLREESRTASCPRPSLPS